MSTQATAARQHHPFSPSKLQCLEACPKFKGIDGDSEASRMGTLQHDVAESGVDDDRMPDYRAMAVAECLKFVDERHKLYPGARFLREAYLPIDDATVVVDGPLTEIAPDDTDPEFVVSVPTPILFHGTTAGYLDVAIVSKDETVAEVIDFKYGAVAVEEAKNNLQGMAYLLGLRKQFPKLRRGIVWFVMPHRDEISGHEFDCSEFDNIHVRIKVSVARAIEANKTEDDFSLAKPSSGACLFCARIGKCPKVAEIALKVGKKHAPVEIPESVSTTVFSDPAQIEKGLKLAQILKTWSESYRSQATAKTIDDPNFVPRGYVLVSSAKRTVKLAKPLGDLAKRFLPDADKEKVEACYDIAIGNLEKLISTAAKRGQKEATVEEFGKLALDAGYLELGAPFAFLRQAK